MWFSLFFFLFLTSATQATEKLWIPLGTPTGSTVIAIQSTPDAQGNTVWIQQPTPLETETPVPGVPIKDGHWVYTYPDNKTTESEGVYSLGQKVGVWKYYGPDGVECRELDYDGGHLRGPALLWASDGGQKYFEHLPDVIQSVAPPEFKLKTLLPYWEPLGGEGSHLLLVIARSDHNSIVMVLDANGQLLDSRPFDGFVDDFVFGQINPGGLFCFGYDRTCDNSLGACQWEFDTWDAANSKMKVVLQSQGWYGKAGPFTLPVFKDDNGTTDIVTDNGTFQWDSSQGVFKTR